MAAHEENRLKKPQKMYHHRSSIKKYVANRRSEEKYIQLWRRNNGISEEILKI